MTTNRTAVQLVIVTAMQSELSNWITRFPLAESLPFPQGAEASGAPLHLNRQSGVLGISTGQGPFAAATSLLALGHDERFDLRCAYWLATGIAGIDPAYGSIGSVVLPRYLVGLGRGYYLDGLGHVPQGRSSPDYDPPYPSNAAAASRGRLRLLDQHMAEMAFLLFSASGVRLSDTDTLRAARARYSEDAARQPPSVTLGGASVTGETFWAGRMSTAWARNASRYFTAGAASLAVTQEEDIAWYEAIASLSRASPPLVNLSRLAYLRAASDYTYEPSGEPHESLPEWFFSDPLHFVAYESFDALFVAGEPIARALAPPLAALLPAAGPTAAAPPPPPRCRAWRPWVLIVLLACTNLCTGALALRRCTSKRIVAGAADMDSSSPRWVELDKNKASQPIA